MKFNLRLIVLSDSDILYKWVNDPITRESSFNTHVIKREEHNSYIESIIKSKTESQFILEVNGKAVGTIKESINQNDIEKSSNAKLSGLPIFTLSPLSKFREEFA